MKKYEAYIEQKHIDNIKLACTEYPLINKDSLKAHEKDLYNEQYIPRYLLYELNICTYYTNLKENGNYDDYKQQFFKQHHMRADKEAEEFYNWINEHEKYEDLLNKDNYDNLTETLKMLDQLQKELLNNSPNNE